MYHVKVKHNYNLAKRSDDADVEQTDAAMVIYRDSDTIKVSLDRRASESAEPECGFDNLLHPPQSTSKLYPRIAAPAPGSSSLSSWTGGGLEQYNPLNVIDPFASSHRLAKRATGCPTTKKINYMGAAADCTYVKYYQSMTNARMQIINDWNTASAAYERSFNVSLGLITITIMSETCPTTVAANATWNRPCSDSYTISSRLSDFSLWRSKIGNDGAGLWHLMTSCATGVEVGVAWLGRLCTSTAITQTDKGVTQHVSGTGVSSIIRDEWKVVAHEIGHGFGAIHDCTSSNCPCSGSSCQCCPLSATQCDAGGTYIMNPSSNVSTNDFSPCSITTICSAFPASGTCLEEPGSRSVKTLQMCGNGIKETGEDCDTGGANSTCCDPATCKFKANAVCEDFNDNCCDKCQLRPASYVCRPASTSCDLEESCSGTSATCPEDKFVTDGDSCGGNSTGLACASGQCTSRDAQCKERGTTMGISRACSSNSNSCELTCDNPGGLGCLIFNGKFIDGTPCGIGGACKDGKCDLSNFGNNAKNWLEKNKAIAIPVGIVLGLLIIFCVLRCIYYSCCGGSRYRTLNNANGGGVYVVNGGPPPYVPGGNSGGIYYPPPPPMQYGPPPPQGWVNPAQYNGYQPNAPPPIYSVPGQQTRDAYEMNTPTNWQAPSPPPPPSSSGPAQPGSPNPGTPPPPTSPNPNNPYTQQQTGPNGARRYQEGVL
ncbi:Metallo-peptidase family M12-domain-containing protein [Phycomyces blakesleeanus]|uniref:Metallo-peptidase family M12-domain-containing protein n=1 Tax=Phycomyces blakesleeanus TaxID=4837 RepID=A0ABR3AN65_PHYBL